MYRISDLFRGAMAALAAHCEDSRRTTSNAKPGGLLIPIPADADHRRGRLETPDRRLSGSKTGVPGLLLEIDANTSTIRPIP